MLGRNPMRSLVPAILAALAASAAGHAQEPEPGLVAAVAGDWRPEADTVRDEWRHPVETLTFFGIDPSSQIAEIDPIGGYYARILIPWISENGGSYRAVVGELDEENPELEAQLAALVANSGGTFELTYGELSATSAEIAPAGSLDAVVTFRNVHNWMGDDFGEKAFEDFFAALKPGGVLGVVEHRLPEDAGDEPMRAGYVKESHVIALAEGAGFVLEETSDINANPADDHDHPVGVWTLKPSRATPREGTPQAQGFDRAAYDAIGESDRMTYRFRKPAA